MGAIRAALNFTAFGMKEAGEVGLIAVAKRRAGDLIPGNVASPTCAERPVASDARAQVTVLRRGDAAAVGVGAVVPASARLALFEVYSLALPHTLIERGFQRRRAPSHCNRLVITCRNPRDVRVKWF